MDEPAAAVVDRIRLHRRVGRGMRHPANWFQLVRFSLVGASGYAVNLAVFAGCVHALGIGYALSAGVAFLVAVVNNFWWNRHWTFAAGHGHAGFQAARFFAVSVVGFLFGLLLLVGLVDGLGLAKVPAQAVAVLCATPVSFLGNKLWTFRH
jgi:putative flippase GtrA